MCVWTAVNANAKRRRRRRRRRLNFKARLMHSSATKATKFDKLSAYKLLPSRRLYAKLQQHRLTSLLREPDLTIMARRCRPRSEWAGERVDVEADKHAHMIWFVDGNVLHL